LSDNLLVVSSLESRAARHAALADVTRLAVVDLLAAQDASPREIAERLGLGSNLLAHHLAVLERAGVVERRRSEADRRRSYVRLVDEAAAEQAGVDGDADAEAPWAGAVNLLFVCTGNSARSQLAAAIWNSHRGDGVPPARSAGTHPAERVDPGAVDVAVRRGLQLAERPVGLVPGDLDDALVVTVCDAAHEELAAGAVTGSLEGSTLHWSVPDPVPLGGDAFETAVDELERRIHRLRPVKEPA
jgi:protein-tyrosine-phosphatase